MCAKRRGHSKYEVRIILQSGNRRRMISPARPAIPRSFSAHMKEAKMKITKLFLVCTCCVLAAPIAWSQATNEPAKPGILGYLDPQTGAFRPAHPPVQDFQLS